MHFKLKLNIVPDFVKTVLRPFPLFLFIVPKKHFSQHRLITCHIKNPFDLIIIWIIVLKIRLQLEILNVIIAMLLTIMFINTKPNTKWNKC